MSKPDSHRIRWHDGKNKVSLISHEEREIVPPKQLPNEYLRIAGVYTYDLNKDQTTDFILHFFNPGNSLASEIGCMFFIISGENGYRVTSFYTFGARSNDLMDISGKGDYRYIHSMFFYGPEGRDGKRHNYWVYHLLKFEGDTLVEDLNAKEFPKWIWYTFKPNHKDTSQLTQEQKDTLWMEGIKENPSLGFHTSNRKNALDSE